MANKYSATLSLTLRGTISDQNATGFGAVASAGRFPFPDLTYGDGNGPGNVNKLYQNQHVIAGTTTLTLRLDDGSLKDVLGNALAFGKIKSIAIYNADATNDVALGGTNSYVSGGTPVKAGGIVVLSNVAGVTVGAGSNNTVTVQNAAGVGVTVFVAIFGSAS